MKTIAIIFSTLMMMSYFSTTTIAQQNYEYMDLAYAPGNDPLMNLAHDNVFVLPVEGDYSTVVRNLTTGGYSGYAENIFIPFENTVTTETDADNSADNKAVEKTNKNWDYSLSYPAGTQLEADAGKEYDTIYFAPFAEFEDQSDVIRQTMTSTVDYTTLYIPKDEVVADAPAEEEVITTETMQLTSIDADANVDDMVKSLENTGVTNYGYISPTINGKVLMITKEEGYRYFDNTAAVGPEKMVSEITEYGKPISELTFYYMLQDLGIAFPENITASEFMNLSIEDQINMVSPLLTGYAAK